MVVAVGADAQVKQIAQAKRGQLHFGDGPDVAGKHRLVDPSRPAKDSRRGERRRGARQYPSLDLHRRTHVGRVRAQPGDERVHVLARLADPGQFQCFQDDRAVGASRHRREDFRRPPEQLQEHHSVQVAADATRVEQCAVKVPQDQEIAHATPLPASSEHPRG